MKRLMIGLGIFVLAAPVSAQWVAGGGYVNLSDESEFFDVSVGGIYASLGYLVESESGLTFLPEMRLGTGVADDTILGVDIELDSFFAFSVRGQFEFDSSFYVYAAPSYARVELTASAAGMSESEDDWEFGVGGGVGYKFSDKAWGELSYETYDGTDVFSIGFKVPF
ncbi:MAG: outer membrane beta-barrel protein [Pseudomonadota bacterium]